MKNILLTGGMTVLILIGYYLGRYLYLKPKNITGDKATEIRGQLPDGSEFSLKNLEGNYVLIDFWGSWCVPCRKTHPQLVALYNDMQFKNLENAKGFEIVSIAIEQNRANWEKAILEDGLSWPYQLLTQDDFETPAAKAYGVKQIPTKFLINPEGIIMAVDPTVEEVTRILEARLVKEG